MICHYHFHAKQPGQRHHQGRAYGMHMQDVGVHCTGLYNGKRGMYNCFEAFFTGGVQVGQPYAFIGEHTVLRIDIWFAAYNCNIVPHGGYAWIKLLTVCFNTALYFRYAACADYYYFHASGLNWFV